MSAPLDKTDRVGHADKTLRGIRQIGSARLFTQLVTWGLTAVTIHLLQPSDYGLIATAGMFTTFAQLLLDGGLSDVLVAQRVLSEEMLGAAASAVFAISSILGALVFASAPAASAFFHSPQLRLVIEVTAFFLPLTALDVVPLALLSKGMHFYRIAYAQTISSVVNGLSTLALAYMGAGYWALIIGSFVGAGIRVGLLWLSLDKRPTPALRLLALRPLVRNSGHMIGQRLTYFSIDNFDMFLLSRFGGPTVLGPYSVSRTLSYSVLNQIAGIVNQVSVPAFAARTETQDQFRGLQFIVSISATTLFPFFWIMGVGSQVALPLVFGHRWINLVLPFLAFTAILPLRGIYTLLNSSVVGTGRTGITFRNTLTWAAIIIPVMMLGVTRGATGVAFSWVIAFPIVFFFGVKRISQSFSAGVLPLLRPMIIPMACAGASALAAEAILLAFARVLAPVLLLACQCCVAGLLYWALLRSLGPAQYQQTLAITRRLIGK